jgi:hypothetical protein
MTDERHNNMTKAADARIADLEKRVRVLEQIIGAAGAMLARGVQAQAVAERPAQPEPGSRGKVLGDLTRPELHELCEQHGIPDAKRTPVKDLIAALRAKGVPG